MHRITVHRADHMIPTINDVEYFSSRINLRMTAVPCMKSKFRPIINREILSSCRDRIALARGPFLPYILRQIKE